jgi:N-glycosylase/DNA lyase
MAYRHLDELRVDWRRSRGEIDRRLADFRRLRDAKDAQLFLELAFCLFAVQTSARRSDAAVQELVARGLHWQGSPAEIASVLRRHVRFHNHKAAYLVSARERFAGRAEGFRGHLDSFQGAPDAREWLVGEIDGFGYKEASHFLRNVGRGERLAILDRHILKNLRNHGVLRAVPDALTRKRYLEIEDRVRRFSSEVHIPIAALDLLFWSRETGEVFK